MNNQKPTISIIVTTYNRIDTLSLVLLALNEQDTDGFEVIVADDGSRNDTKEAIESLKSQVSYSLKHVWHIDDGFRASMIRNKSVALACGKYLIFLDGDSVPQTSFISRHMKFAEENYFVSGNRVLLSSGFTEQVLAKYFPIYCWNKWSWFLSFCRGKINRFQPIMFFSGEKAFWRYLCKNQWRGVKTCNLGVWKRDFLAVNGFDEGYYGWGYEDSDFIVRLMHYGVLRKDGRFALPIFHLHHVGSSRSRELINYKKLEEVIGSSRIRSELGVDQYLEKGSDLFKTKDLEIHHDVEL